MNHTTIFIGLDVHKDSTAVAVSEPGARARFVGAIGPELGELRKVLGKPGEPGDLQVVYEAGPCGYGLVRRLRSAGYVCEVIAPARLMVWGSGDPFPGPPGFLATLLTPESGCRSRSP